MTADDLPALFDTLPEAWAAVLSGWTPELRAEVCRRVGEVSGARPIGPLDPFRALRLVAPEGVKVVIFGQDPYPTSPEDIIEWLRDHYREHVQQSADLVREAGSPTQESSTSS